MSWTDERVETLKKMWSDGQSASQIAKELGGVTRNAVIGKVHRLGLSNRTGGTAAAAATTGTRADTAATPEPAAAAEPDRRFLVLRPLRAARKTLLRGACGRRVPADELAPRPSPLIPRSGHSQIRLRANMV